MAKFASPQMMTEIAVPWARAVVGKTSVGKSQTVESQPMPKAPVATNRIRVPMTPGTRTGMCNSEAFATRPPKRARRAKDEERMMEPWIRRLRRPSASMRSQASVMRKK